MMYLLFWFSFADGTGTKINEAGITYYNNLIDALLEKGVLSFVWDLHHYLHCYMMLVYLIFSGIHPYVTLYYWDVAWYLCISFLQVYNHMWHYITGIFLLICMIQWADGWAKKLCKYIISYCIKKVLISFMICNVHMASPYFFFIFSLCLVSNEGKSVYISAEYLSLFTQESTVS